MKSLHQKKLKTILFLACNFFCMRQDLSNQKMINILKHRRSYKSIKLASKLFFILFFCVHTDLFSQSLTDYSNLRFEHLTDNGLSDNSINCFLQDKQGFI